MGRVTVQSVRESQRGTSLGLQKEKRKRKKSDQHQVDIVREDFRE
jgi:hypothetical protein